MFRENNIVTITVGVLGIILAIAAYFKSEWFPNRGTLMSGKFPDELHHMIRTYTSLFMLAASIYILLGYRLESYRVFGTAAVIVLASALLIYLYALVRFKKEKSTAQIPPGCGKSSRNTVGPERGWSDSTGFRPPACWPSTPI